MTTLRPGDNDKETEFLGWVGLNNEHNNSDNGDMYDRIRLEGSTFQRDILHFIRVQDFNPWTVIERLKPENYIGKNDIYLMYAGGDAFALIGAKLRIYVAAYNSGENNIEGLWIQKYEEPLVITEE